MFAVLLALVVSAAADAQATKTTRIIGIVATYSDTTQSGKPSTLDRYLFTHPSSSFKAFVKAGSGGMHAVTGDTHPTIVRLDQTRPLGQCVAPDNSRLHAAIVDAGIDLSRYTTISLVINASASGCNGGIAKALGYRQDDGTPGYMPMAINWSLNNWYIVHELGHTEGLGHAQSVRCGSLVVGPRCTVRQYGNRWDAMGDGFVMFQAANRARLGWIEPIVHASGRATHTLGAAGAPGGLPVALEVRLPKPRDGSPIRVIRSLSLWIEYRAPIGFDAIFSNRRWPALGQGAFVNVSGRWEGLGRAKTANQSCAIPSPCLLDMTPESATFYDAALPVGRTWTDPFTGTTITVDSRTDTSLTVTVDVPLGDAQLARTPTPTSVPDPVRTFYNPLQITER